MQLGLGTELGKAAKGKEGVKLKYPPAPSKCSLSLPGRAAITQSIGVGFEALGKAVSEVSRNIPQHLRNIFPCCRPPN